MSVISNLETFTVLFSRVIFLLIKFNFDAEVPGLGLNINEYELHKTKKCEVKRF